MSLRQKQSKFVRLLAKLIIFAYDNGYELTLGDAYRSPDVKYGHENSNHRRRLAVDFNLFKDGVYHTDTKDYTLLGEYWESLSEDCAWGGRFKGGDGNHFSFKHNGMR